MSKTKHVLSDGGLRKQHFCPRSIYPLKFNNGNATKRCEICSKLIIKTPQGHH